MTRKASTRKALKMRGGFTPSKPPRLKPINPSNANSFIGKTLKDAASRTSNPGASFARMLGKVAAERIVQDIAGTAYQRIKAAPGTNKGSNSSGEIARSSTEVVTRANPTGASGKVYKTKFYVGQEPTRAVKEAERQGGSQKVTRLDTEVNNVTAAARTPLAISYGFNRKEFAWYNSTSHWSPDDVQFMTAIATHLADEETRNQRVYWMSKYFGMKYKILNTNKFLRTKVKIHFCAQLDTTDSAQDSMASFANTTASTQLQTRIPIDYQFNDLVVNGSRENVAVDPYLCNIKSSEGFNARFAVAKTFTKTLMPGEVWELDYRHFTGPGLRLDDIYAKDFLGTKFNAFSALFLYPVFELVGPQVECYDSTDPNVSYVGTGSGQVRLEMKKYAEICTTQGSLNDIYDAVTGFEKGNWAFRVYSDPPPSDTVTTKRFNVAYENILRDGEASAAGKFVIPVSTDTAIVRAGRDKIAS